ncbi:MAG: hypothetical protein DHS80DRAFT_25768 [Piptocephalis tieghemiana]|nr:MAG: hypothetical protein DHS80DRAFT_25768 [Piptocephalis tieghemiana]
MALSFSIPISYLLLPFYLILAGTFALWASITTLFSLGLLSFRVYLVYASLIYGITINAIQQAFASFLTWASKACSSLAERWRPSSPSSYSKPMHALASHHNPLQPRPQISHVRKILVHPSDPSSSSSPSPSDLSSAPESSGGATYFTIGSTPPSPLHSSRLHTP